MLGATNSMHASTVLNQTNKREDAGLKRRERRVLAVVMLTAVTMVAEIIIGHLSNSIALLADGWHMATHVGALGLASCTYVIARRFQSSPLFPYGTGKIDALSGLLSALGLGAVAITMMSEAVSRLFQSKAIDFSQSIPVAVLGLAVNVVSVWLLDTHDHDHEQEHGHDHGRDHAHTHEAALRHIIADTLTSAVAIVALLMGRYLHWSWPDAVGGIIGGLVVLKWAIGLCRSTSLVLLDVDSMVTQLPKIKSALESVGDARVSELHVRPIGHGQQSCVATVVSAKPQDVLDYRASLAEFPFAHLAIEVRTCREGH
jgi:cation diffusion facilitator family transporter